MLSFNKSRAMVMAEKDARWRRERSAPRARKAREVAGFVLPETIVTIRETPSDDETGSGEARLKKGFVPDEEISADHVLSGSLSESDRQACMDPLEYALRKRDPEQYGVKAFGRNLRLV